MYLKLYFFCHKVSSTRNGKLWRLSGWFQTLIWRPGKTVQNLESPGLSGRVDSPAKLSFLYNYALFFCHVLLLHKFLGKNKNEKLDLHLCDQVVTLIVIGIIAELQAREARAWSEPHSLVNLPIPENFVIRWPYTNRPPAQLSIRTTGTPMFTFTLSNYFDCYWNNVIVLTLFKATNREFWLLISLFVMEAPSNCICNYYLNIFVYF